MLIGAIYLISQSVPFLANNTIYFCSAVYFALINVKTFRAFSGKNTNKKWKIERKKIPS